MLENNIVKIVVIKFEKIPVGKTDKMGMFMGKYD